MRLFATTRVMPTIRRRRADAPALPSERRLWRGRQRPPLRRRPTRGLAEPRRPMDGSRLRRALPSAGRADRAPPPDDGPLQARLFAERDHRAPAITSSARSARDWRTSSSTRSASPGRPNGYILGEDAGGAFVAGLRYGEGTLYTKDAGAHKVYWQGPSIGYDFGGEGSKTMMLVYNLRDPMADLRPLRRRARLGLFRRRRRHPVPDPRQCDAGAHPRRHRAPARCQRRIFEVYPRADVEPVLSRRAAGKEAPGGEKRGWLHCA